MKGTIGNNLGPERTEEEGIIFMKCERCGKELSGLDLYCDRCGRAVFPEYMDEADVWANFKTDEELEQILKEEEKPTEEEAIEEEPIEEEPIEEEPIEEKLIEEEEWNFDDEEEEEQEEDAIPPTPKMKKNRLLKRSFISVFLIACLGIGVYLGIYRVREMEKQEEAYNKELAKSASEKPEVMQVDKPDEKKPVKEEPKKEPKKEYFKMEDVSSIDLKKFKKVAVNDTEENSIKSSESYDYSAKSAVDGDISSSWQENAEGTGEGTGFKLSLNQSHKVRYLVLYLGNWRSDQLWDYNARPKTLTIQVGEHEKKDVEFPNKKEAFCLSFDEPLDVSSISIYIKESYKGSRWQDNCISEIEIFE